MGPQDHLNLVVKEWKHIERVYEPVDILMMPRNPVCMTLVLTMLCVQTRAHHRRIQLCGARPTPADVAWAATPQASIDSKLLRSLMCSYAFWICRHRIPVTTNSSESLRVPGPEGGRSYGFGL